MAARRLSVLVVVVAVLVGGAVQAQEILTNEGVITMVKGGLSENLVVAKIRATTTHFDLRADALVGLKAAGVPERVLEAMLYPGGPAFVGATGASMSPSASVSDRLRR